jgi:hypothetical protein
MQDHQEAAEAAAAAEVIYATQPGSSALSVGKAAGAGSSVLVESLVRLQYWSRSSKVSCVQFKSSRNC